MIKHNNELKTKINIIDDLLNDDKKLEDYIDKVEHKGIIVPDDLKENINKKINNEYKLIKTSKQKNKYFDLMKIAICTVLALMLWESSFTKNIEARNINTEEIKQNKISEKIDNAIKKINTFFIKIDNFKGEE